jgi:hypothetical protein
MEDVAERVGGLEAALEMFILNTDRRLAQADAEAAEREERRERAQAEARTGTPSGVTSEWQLVKPSKICGIGDRTHCWHSSDSGAGFRGTCSGDT